MFYEGEQKYPPAFEVVRGDELDDAIEAVDAKGNVIGRARLDYAYCPFNSALSHVFVRNINAFVKRAGVGSALLSSICHMLQERDEMGLLINRTARGTRVRGMYARRGWEYVNVQGVKDLMVYQPPYGASHEDISRAFEESVIREIPILGCYSVT